MESTEQFEKLLINDVVIVQLIKNDIINSRLINDLKGIGFVQQKNDYTLDLYRIIFDYFGIKDFVSYNEIVEWYFLYIERICNDPLVSKAGAIETLALELYCELKKQIVPDK